jgi:TRAP-type C4-dicarboxylate transport system permease small subunit
MVKSPKGELILNMISNTAFLVFAVAIAYFSYQGVYRLKEVNPQVSPAVGFPMWIAYLSVSVGFTLMIYRIIADTWIRIRAYNEKTKGSVLA